MRHEVQNSYHSMELLIAVVLSAFWEPSKSRSVTVLFPLLMDIPN